MPDIVMRYILITIGLMLSNICFMIPSLAIIAISMIFSFGLAISLPAFLFFAFFEVLGAESVNVLEFGFLKTLLACTIATPIGVMNLKSLKYMGI